MRDNGRCSSPLVGAIAATLLARLTLREIDVLGAYLASPPRRCRIPGVTSMPWTNEFCSRATQ